MASIAISVDITRGSRSENSGCPTEMIQMPIDGFIILVGFHVIARPNLRLWDGHGHWENDETHCT